MSDKQGISAEVLRKAIGYAYDTAFTLLHRLRWAMAERDQRYLRMGAVEVDDAYVSGHGDGRYRSGRARDSKRVIGVAAAALQGMLLGKVRRGFCLQTDGWPGYQGLDAKGFVHHPVASPGGAAACATCPLVHRAISNFTRWLLGTHRQFCQRHLDSYAAEFCWRVNHRNASKEGRQINNRRAAMLSDRLLAHACATGPRRRQAALAVAA